MNELAKRTVSHAAVLCVVACSGGAADADPDPDAGQAGAFPTAAGGDASEMGEEPGDHALIVPDGLRVRALPGGNGVLDVTALTLRRGAINMEVYAALRNSGDVAACSAAFSIELFDRTEQSLAAGIGGLLTQHFYRVTDGSGAIAACVGPGDVTMAAVTELPSGIAVEDVGTVIYRCPYFALDVVPIAGLEVKEVTSLAGRVGTAYAGTLVNRLDVTVQSPSVTVFPINRVGRPLGVAIGSATVEVPPGGSWAFETDIVSVSGVGHLAYPAGALRQ